MTRVREIRQKVAPVAWPVEAVGWSRCLHEAEPLGRFGHCWQLPASAQFRHDLVWESSTFAAKRSAELREVDPTESAGQRIAETAKGLLHSLDISQPRRSM